jgi:hypothetical protein
MDFCESYVEIASMRSLLRLVANAEVFAQAVVQEEWLKALRYWLMMYYPVPEGRILFVSGF